MSMASGDYWKKRHAYDYYETAVGMVKTLCPDAMTLIDIGTGNTEYLWRLGWVPCRASIDPGGSKEIPGVIRINAGWMYVSVSPVDVILCLQVMEHLANPVPFATKILSKCRFAIVSVPYLWPAGTCPDHVQDPCDLAKVCGWMGKDAVSSAVVTEGNGSTRLVAAFIGTGGRE